MATVLLLYRPPKTYLEYYFSGLSQLGLYFFFNAKLGAILTKKCTSPNALIYPSRCAGVHTYTTIVHKTSFREAFHILFSILQRLFTSFSLTPFQHKLQKRMKMGLCKCNCYQSKQIGERKKAILDYKLNAKMLSPLPHILFSKHESAKKSQSDIFD